MGFDWWKGHDLTPTEMDVRNDFIGDQFNEQIVPILESNPRYFDKKHFTLDLYRWMGAVVLSYSFTFPKDDDVPCDQHDGMADSDRVEVMMVPMADMLNQRTGYNNARCFQSDGKKEDDEETIDKDGEKCTTEKPSEHVVLEMIAISRIEKSCEIVNTYVDLPNAELLRKYSFRR